MAKTIEISGLRIDEKLYDLVRDEIAPGTGVDADEFWQSLAAIVRDLGPRNQVLLEKRDELQNQIDRYHLARKGEPFKQEEYTATLKDGGMVGLADAGKFTGYQEKNGELTSILLSNNGSRIEIQIDRSHPIGKAHPAGVKDVVMEAAITTIEDCEDAVAAVDAADKIGVYRSWCGIMKGTLEATFDKGGRSLHRRLNSDKTFITPTGGQLILPGRRLLLVRNVGIHMYTDAVTTADGQEIPEGFLDAMVTALAAIHDLKGS